MKTFKIIETAQAEVTWIHTVEAESEEEALEIVMNGEAQDSKSFIEPDFNTCKFEVVRFVS